MPFDLGKNILWDRAASCPKPGELKSLHRTNLNDTHFDMPGHILENGFTAEALKHVVLC